MNFNYVHRKWFLFMITTFFRILCFLILILFAFVLGVSLNLNPQLDVTAQAKLMVANFMYQPQATEFRNVKLYAAAAGSPHNIIGNVCGEVFTFKDEAPYQYEKFIIQVAKDKNKKNILSFPLFDFEGEMIPEADFQKIWQQRCVNEIPVMAP
ncbi:MULTISPECIES: hypothetical protein [Providencia]|uniref:hypothetical protein n=2 Tax=Providencia TaxID=586 RepID=UPI0019808F7E|nr:MULTISPECIES: hypothetical protein [Providencia]MBN4865054.1 hypothetical protein [Providencia stuartii]MBN4874721.1 hypothetical protein [Providencia stuartii]MBN4879066.1 hypothetical protein [Providencia stuartii]MBN4883921.1 hypothetical protein [Providencia stuartii]